MYHASSIYFEPNSKDQEKRELRICYSHDNKYVCWNITRSGDNYSAYFSTEMIPDIEKTLELLKAILPKDEAAPEEKEQNEPETGDNSTS